MSSVLKYCNILLLSLIILFYGCIKEDSNKSVFVGDVSLISEFPYSDSLKEIEGLNGEHIGLVSIKVVDSLLFIGHSDCWEVKSLSTGKIMKCFSKGSGPSEFLEMPGCQESAFEYENDSLFVYTSNLQKGTIMRTNITKLMDEGVEDTRSHLNSTCLDKKSWFVTVCDSKSFLVVVPDSNHVSFSRVMYDSGNVSEPEITKPSSKVRVDDPNNLSKLAKIVNYNPHKYMFVEGMLYLNQLHLYSKDGKTGKTICVGDGLDDIAYIEEHSRDFRKTDYVAVSSFDDGFCAVFSGFVESDENPGPKNLSELQFFDWNGNPVDRIRLPYSARECDLDIDRGILYVIDENADRLVAYNVSPVLRKYQDLPENRL